TLIELLVVILIIGILAAIAIPAFLSQTSKASDSAAKTQVGTLQTTMEAYASDNNGSYEQKGSTTTGTAPTLAELEAIEPTLKDTTTAAAQAPEVTGPSQFKVESIASGTKNKYWLEDNAGTISRTCEVVSESTPGGCKNVASKKGEW
ncbi:MAG TPA: prepilin-type N-terminal cleavage/methylation domain-containing protein, partial [Solirubrobacteraceae bacterium]|nr:prepilin-type N-terminal cleavage/methylation domain-containing protein [Solirubrobacteraceae bacterium]